MRAAAVTPAMTRPNTVPQGTEKEKILFNIISTQVGKTFLVRKRIEKKVITNFICDK